MKPVRRSSSRVSKPVEFLNYGENEPPQWQTHERKIPPLKLPKTFIPLTATSSKFRKEAIQAARKKLRDLRYLNNCSSSVDYSGSSDEKESNYSGNSVEDINDDSDALSGLSDHVTSERSEQDLDYDYESSTDSNATVDISKTVPDIPGPSNFLATLLPNAPPHLISDILISWNFLNTISVSENRLFTDAVNGLLNSNCQPVQNVLDVLGDKEMAGTWPILTIENFLEMLMETENSYLNALQIRLVDIIYNHVHSAISINNVAAGGDRTSYAEIRTRPNSVTWPELARLSLGAFYQILNGDSSKAMEWLDAQYDGSVSKRLLENLEDPSSHQCATTITTIITSTGNTAVNTMTNGNAASSGDVTPSSTIGTALISGDYLTGSKETNKDSKTMTTCDISASNNNTSCTEKTATTYDCNTATAITSNATAPATCTNNVTTDDDINTAKNCASNVNTDIDDNTATNCTNNSTAATRFKFGDYLKHLSNINTGGSLNKHVMTAARLRISLWQMNNVLEVEKSACHYVEETCKRLNVRNYTEVKLSQGDFSEKDMDIFLSSIYAGPDTPIFVRRLLDLVQGSKMQNFEKRRLLREAIESTPDKEISTRSQLAALLSGYMRVSRFQKRAEPTYFEQICTISKGILTEWILKNPKKVLGVQLKENQPYIPKENEDTLMESLRVNKKIRSFTQFVNPSTNSAVPKTLKISIKTSNFLPKPISKSTKLILKRPKMTLEERKAERSARTLGNILTRKFRVLVRFIALQPDAYFFWLPVDEIMFPQYRTIISQPIDLRTIDRNLSRRVYNRSFKAAYKDLCLIFSNACKFNLDGSTVFETAVRLQMLSEKIYMHWIYPYLQRRMKEADFQNSAVKLKILNKKLIESAHSISSTNPSNKFSAKPLNLHKTDVLNFSSDECNGNNTQTNTEMQVNNIMQSDATGCAKIECSDSFKSQECQMVNIMDERIKKGKIKLEVNSLQECRNETPTNAVVKHENLLMNDAIESEYLIHQWDRSSENSPKSHKSSIQIPESKPNEFNDYHINVLLSANIWTEGCKMCNQDASLERNLVKCVQCQFEFHLSCLDPSLSKVPSGAWTCSICTKGTHQNASLPSPQEIQKVVSELNDIISNLPEISIKRPISSTNTIKTEKKSLSNKNDVKSSGEKYRDLAIIARCIVRELAIKPEYEVFRQPVNLKMFPLYEKVIPNRMDLHTLELGLLDGVYTAKCDEKGCELNHTYLPFAVLRFANDLRLISKCCLKFNTPGSQVYQVGEKFRLDVRKLLQNRLFSAISGRSNGYSDRQVADLLGKTIDWGGTNLTFGCFLCESKESSRENQLLWCDSDGCDREIHMHCLPDRLYSVPKGKWFCLDCLHGNGTLEKLRQEMKCSKMKSEPNEELPIKLEISPVDSVQTEKSCANSSDLYTETEDNQSSIPIRAVDTHEGSSYTLSRSGRPVRNINFCNINSGFDFQLETGNSIRKSTRKSTSTYSATDKNPICRNPKIVKIPGKRSSSTKKMGNNSNPQSVRIVLNRIDRPKSNQINVTRKDDIVYSSGGILTEEGAQLYEYAEDLIPCETCWRGKNSGVKCRAILLHHKDSNWNATGSSFFKPWIPPAGFLDWLKLYEWPKSEEKNIESADSTLKSAIFKQSILELKPKNADFMEIRDELKPNVVKHMILNPENASRDGDTAESKPMQPMPQIHASKKNNETKAYLVGNGDTKRKSLLADSSPISTNSSVGNAEKTFLEQQCNKRLKLHSPEDSNIKESENFMEICTNASNLPNLNEISADSTDQQRENKSNLIDQEAIKNAFDQSLQEAELKASTQIAGAVSEIKSQMIKNGIDTIKSLPTFKNRHAETSISNSNLSTYELSTKNLPNLSVPFAEISNQNLNPSSFELSKQNFPNLEAQRCNESNKNKLNEHVLDTDKNTINLNQPSYESANQSSPGKWEKFRGDLFGSVIVFSSSETRLFEGVTVDYDCQNGYTVFWCPTATIPPKVQSSIPKYYSEHELEVAILTSKDIYAFSQRKTPLSSSKISNDSAESFLRKPGSYASLSVDGRARIFRELCEAAACTDVFREHFDVLEQRKICLKMELNQLRKVEERLRKDIMQAEKALQLAHKESTNKTHKSNGEKDLENLKMNFEKVTKEKGVLISRIHSINPQILPIGFDRNLISYYSLPGCANFIFTISNNDEQDWGSYHGDEKINELIGCLLASNEKNDRILAKKLQKIIGSQKENVLDPGLKSDSVFPIGPECALFAKNGTRRLFSKKCDACIGSCTLHATSWGPRNLKLSQEWYHTIESNKDSNGRELKALRWALLRMAHALPPSAFRENFWFRNRVDDIIDKRLSVFSSEGEENNDCAVLNLKDTSNVSKMTVTFAGWTAFVRYGVNSPRELLQAVLILEESITGKHLCKSYSQKAKHPAVSMRYGDNIHNVALRIYSLDSALIYENAESNKTLKSGQKKRKILSTSLSKWRGAHSDFCETCKFGGFLLCCDYCSRAFHLKMSCCGEVSEPKGNWACPNCAVLTRDRITR